MVKPLHFFWGGGGELIGSPKQSSSQMLVNGHQLFLKNAILPLLKWYKLYLLNLKSVESISKHYQCIIVGEA